MVTRATSVFDSERSAPANADPPTVRELRTDDRPARRTGATDVIPASVLQDWLEALCRQIPNQREALVQIDAAAGGAHATWPRGGASDPELIALVERARRQERAALQAGASGAPVRIATTVRVAGRIDGAVAVRCEGLADAQRQIVVQVLEWGSTWLELTLGRVQDTHGSFDELMADLQAAFDHPRFEAVALAVVSTFAHRLGFDRGALGVARSGGVRLAAISDAPTPNRRTAFAKALETAMTETLRHGDTVVTRADAAGRSQTLEAHRVLTAEGDARSVLSVPLRHRGRVHAVLMLERITDEPIEPITVNHAESLAAVLGPALDLKYLENRSFLARLAGTSSAKVGRVPWLALALALVAAGSLVEGEYRVTAPTQVAGALERAVVAPFDGYIDTALARAGDEVQTGDVLATLQEEQLRLERSKWAGERDELRKQYRRALAERDRAEARVLEARMAGASAQVDLLDAQLERTKLVAPFDGIVLSGDLRASLGAPVERGQVLFAIAPVGDYRIELQLDERDVGEVNTGMTGTLTLAALPEQSLPLRLARVTTASKLDGGRNVFSAEAELDKPIGDLRPGMEGVAKIVVDERKLVWIWTHRFVEWLQLALWSWRP